MIVEDAFANPVSASPNVTLSLTSSPSGASLLGTLTQSTVNGTATFSGLSIHTAGTGDILTASSPGLPSAQSSTFNVTAAAATQLGFGVEPSNAVAGAALNPAITVLAKDTYGNAAARA